jgi:hypothetical protein
LLVKAASHVGLAGKVETQLFDALPSPEQMPAIPSACEEWWLRNPEEWRCAKDFNEIVHRAMENSR